MKEYTTDFIRNIALVSHGSGGKTMLTEAFLHVTGATTRLGKIDDGSTVSDFEDEEIRRKLSLSTTVIPVEYKDHKINFLDTPGYTDFIGEVVSALSIADGAVVLVDAVGGLEVGTELVWNYCDTFNLPRIVLINKMDRDNADFQRAIASVQEYSPVRLIPVQLPWGEKADFKGVIDLISMKAYANEGRTAEEIPDEFKSAAEEARMKLVEAAAEGEDALLEKYLESGELTTEELLRGLKAILRSQTYVLTFASAGGHEVGVFPLLDALVNLMPSPSENVVTAKGKSGEEKISASDTDPLAVYIWKTTADPFVGKLTYFRIYSGALQGDAHIWNQNKSAEERMAGLSVLRGKETIPVKVMHSGDIGIVAKLTSTTTGDTLCDRNHPLTLTPPDYPNALFQVAVRPKTQADAAKITSALNRLCEEDMTLSWHQESATGQTILQGMGDQHIDAAIRRAENKLQVGLVIGEPKVPYREGITKKAQAMYRHKKQSGGAGQFGEVWLRIEPCPESDFEFTDELVGMNLSKSYLPAIEKGIHATLQSGVMAGFPLSNVRVIVYDGKEHPVDSKPVAFEIAGREAFKLAVKDAGPVLFEPIMTVHITIPDSNMGDVMGDLNSRRGRVQGTESDRGRTIVNAFVPLAEMLRYTTQLRSITGGRGVFTMDLDRYEIVPAHLAQEIIDAHQKELEEKKEE
jgi:elongation factor G